MTTHASISAITFAPGRQMEVATMTRTAPTYRIVTLSGRGLPRNVDADGYGSRLAAEAMADAEHSGEYRIEEVR